MNTIETIEYRGFAIEIYQEMEDFGNPREIEGNNLGIMVCKHRNYNLGDREASDDINWSALSETLQSKDDTGNPAEYLKKNHGAVVVLPLFLHDHSGISMSCSRVCQWDSSYVGYIYTTAEKIKAHFGVKRITSAVKENATQALIREVKEYSAYIEGNVIGYQWEYGGCGGFLIVDRKDQDNMIEEAKAEIDSYIKGIEKEHAEYLKKAIKNKVSINFRKPITIGGN